MPILIPNPQNLEKLKAQIKAGGYQNLHILSDFDRTLTYGAINGVKTPSILSMLRDGNHLTAGYAEKAHALFNHYQPFESDLKIPLVERKQKMQEWWATHNKLLTESGLSKADLKDIVQNGPVKLREGVAEFLDWLYQHHIPLIILSASGCGDAIQMFFQKIGKDYPNIFYLINKFNWDENGRATSTKGPIIHTLNKDETVLTEIPEIYPLIENRKNVILLGDGIGDLDMIKGFAYDALLKIGFLNTDYDKDQEAYEKSFDLIIKGDEDFGPINDLMKNLI